MQACSMLVEIERFVNWVRRRSPEAYTWRDYHCDLACFVEAVGDRPPSELTFHDVDHFLTQEVEQGFQPTTINRRLAAVAALYAFLAPENDELVCPVFPRRHHLREPERLPRPVAEAELRQFFEAITEDEPNARRDRAMFTLMLRCGLRTCEVRSLRLEHLDLEGRRARIEQSKGLKDRTVFLSPASLAALQGYLEVRGPQDALPEQVFVYAHKPLSKFYCGERLHTYGRRCGVQVTPHQLRHSCATLLLNAGAPVLSVQALLGHKYVDTTLRYARLYDGTVAADYYGAMAIVERQLILPENARAEPLGAGQLLALVDSLREGTLNPTQAEAVRQLRAGIAALTEQDSNKAMEDVKVPK